MTGNDECWENLCAAVVRKAIEDYAHVLKYPTARESAYLKADCERFFKTDIALFSDYSGESIMRQIRGRYERV